MNVIPVIDLLGGQVVHAKKGERNRYKPIQSLLTPSSNPLDIVQALLEVYPFKQLYIADLDAIQNTGTARHINYNVIATIKQRFYELEIMVDAGIQSPQALDIWHLSGVNIILGSENYQTLNDFLLVQTRLQNHFTLSLDFFANGFRGPSELIESSQHWPQNVIVMTLENVGANQGVNMSILEKVRQLSQETKLFAAGGVRNQLDLFSLKELNIQGALVASALHQMQITGREINEINKKAR